VLEEVQPSLVEHCVTTQKNEDFCYVAAVASTFADFTVYLSYTRNDLCK